MLGRYTKGLCMDYNYSQAAIAPPRAFPANPPSRVRQPQEERGEGEGGEWATRTHPCASAKNPSYPS